jgi:hypothetical protein
MPLDNIIRSAVKIADKVSDPVQETLTHVVWRGANGLGAPYPTLAVTCKALVEQSTKMVQTKDGKLVETMAKLTFLKPMPNYTVAGRTNPIDGNDQFILADGTVGKPVPGVKGLRKGTPFLLEVWLQ